MPRNAPSARYKLPLSELDKLISKKVKKLRVYTTDGYVDSVIKEKRQEAIQQTFALLKQIAEKVP